jgi:hypothetical protein
LMLANYKEERDPLSDYLEKSLFLVLTSPTWIHWDSRKFATNSKTKLVHWYLVKKINQTSSSPETPFLLGSSSPYLLAAAIASDW